MLPKKKYWEGAPENLKDKTVRMTTKLEIGDLVITAEKVNVFSNGDTTNWSYKLYTITKILMDTIASYPTKNLRDRYNEGFLRKTTLAMKKTLTS